MSNNVIELVLPPGSDLYTNGQAASALMPTGHELFHIDTAQMQVR